MVSQHKDKSQIQILLLLVLDRKRQCSEAAGKAHRLIFAGRDLLQELRNAFSGGQLEAHVVEKRHAALSVSMVHNMPCPAHLILNALGGSQQHARCCKQGSAGHVCQRVLDCGKNRGPEPSRHQQIKDNRANLQHLQMTGHGTWCLCAISGKASLPLVSCKPPLKADQQV